MGIASSYVKQARRVRNTPSAGTQQLTRGGIKSASWALNICLDRMVPHHRTLAPSDTRKLPPACIFGRGSPVRLASLPPPPHPALCGRQRRRTHQGRENQLVLWFGSLHEMPRWRARMESGRDWRHPPPRFAPGRQCLTRVAALSGGAQCRLLAILLRYSTAQWQRGRIYLQGKLPGHTRVSQTQTIHETKRGGGGGCAPP